MQLRVHIRAVVCSMLVLLASWPGANAADAPATLSPSAGDPAPTQDDAAPSTCALDPGPTHAVTAVIDGETVRLDDGSEVRLAGALTPRPPDSALDVSYWPPERDAKAALENLVLGRSVTLAFSGRRTDRYGRTLAQLFVMPTPIAAHDQPTLAPRWVQAELLAAGHARAFALRDSGACLRELAAHEALARRAGSGLWSHAAYRERDAADGFGLMRLRSTYQLVVGVVSKAITTRNAVILRFSPDDLTEDQVTNADDVSVVRPTRGFSIAVKPAIARIWAATGQPLEGMKGRRLLVRGWIERRGGPTIEIVDPYQIELLPEASVAAAVPPESTPRRRIRRGREASAPSTQSE